MSGTPSAWLSSVPTILRCWHWSRRGSGEAVLAHSAHGGADVVLEVAGSEDTFRLAWECARPNAVVTVVALYDRPQLLPLPDMYGKNLTFKTGGVDGCNCAQTLDLIAAGKLDTTPIITHTYPLKDIDAAYQLFESRREGVIKVAIQPLTPPPAILRQIAPQGAGGTLWIP